MCNAPLSYQPIAQSTKTPKAKTGCSPNATGMNAAE